MTEPHTPDPDEALVERVARAITYGDPDRMSYESISPGHPEPWGPAWMRAVPEAEKAIALVRAHDAALAAMPSACPAGGCSGDMVLVPRVLLGSIHAAMRMCGWQLAPAQDDAGEFEEGLAHLEEMLGEVIGARPAAHGAGFAAHAPETAAEESPDAECL